MKLFRYLTLKVFIKDALIAAKVYQVLYQGDKVMVNEPIQNQLPNYVSKTIPVESYKESRSYDAQTALNELKSKSFKTKKDKESIEVLEAVIKNGY